MKHLNFVSDLGNERQIGFIFSVVSADRILIEGVWMGMIDRYQKPGGFTQLLVLIETCGPQKQEKFLQMIRDESPPWEEAIRTKMLTIERIFSWDYLIIGEIMNRLQPLTIATALFGLTSEQGELAQRTLSISQKRKIESFKEISKPNAAEIATAYMRIVSEVREMVAKRVLDFNKFDSELVIEDNIESVLDRLTLENPPTSIVSAIKEPAQSVRADNDKIELLKKKIHRLTNDLNRAHEELKDMEEKLNRKRKSA